MQSRLRSLTESIANTTIGAAFVGRGWRRMNPIRVISRQGFWDRGW